MSSTDAPSVQSDFDLDCLIKSLLWCFNDLPKGQISDCSNLKQCADDNSKFDENGGKFSKKVEKLWKKEKLPVTSNFSFPTVFSKDLYGRHVKTRACLGKG